MTYTTHTTHTTTNGYTVLIDPEDCPRIAALLDAGVRLQSHGARGGLRVILREYGGSGYLSATMLLSKFILGAAENQVVEMLRGPLDHRRESMEPVIEPSRRGWSSHIHAAQRSL